MLLFFSFLLCLELGRLFFFRGGSTRGSHGDSVLGTGEFHRYIDGHKGRVAASMAWAGVGALDATSVRSAAARHRRDIDLPPDGNHI